MTVRLSQSIRLPEMLSKASLAGQFSLSVKLFS